MEEYDDPLPPDDENDRNEILQEIKNNSDDKSEQNNLSSSKDQQTLFNTLLNLQPLDNCHNPLSELEHQKKQMYGSIDDDNQYQCYSDDDNTKENNQNLYDINKADSLIKEDIISHNLPQNEISNNNSTIKKNNAYSKPTKGRQITKLKIAKQRKIINNRNLSLIENCRPIELYGESVACYNCSKIYDKNLFFLYKRKFMCLKCSVDVKDIRLLSDWEVKPISGKTKSCSRCNCKRSVRRFKEGRKYCSYCSLKKKYKYQISKIDIMDVSF